MSDIKMLHLYSCELDAPTREVTLPTPLMHQDAYADVFRIHVTRGGLDLQLDGMTVRAWLYLAATGETMLLEGSADGSMVMVTLEPECYLFPGYATLAIQLQQGEECRTLIKIDLAIKRTCTDTVIDPSNVLPTLPELLAQIAAMEQGTAAANAAAEAANAAAANAKEFIVTVTTPIIAGEAATADKTFAEITAAINAGKTPVVRFKTQGKIEVDTLHLYKSAPISIVFRQQVKHTADYNIVSALQCIFTTAGISVDSVNFRSVPDGGTEGQVLVKTGESTYGWRDPVKTAPPIVPTATGSIVNITDGAARPAVEVISHIEPAETGTGEKGPNNPWTISGWNSVTAQRTGKNILPGGGDEKTGSFLLYATDKAFVGAKGREINVSFDLYSPDGSAVSVYAYQQSGLSIGNGYDFMPSTGVYARYSFNTSIIKYGQTLNAGNIIFYSPSGAAVKVKNVQVEFGTTATGYEPYEGKTISATLPETVYGGDVYWHAGKLYNRCHKIVFDGVTTGAKLDMTDVGSWSYAYILPENMPKPLKPYTTAYANRLASVSTNNVMAFSLPAELTGVTSADDRFAVAAKYNAVLKQWYDAGTPLEIVYELATPEEIQLTPQQLSTLHGINNVWSDCGDTTISYVADTQLYIDNKLASISEALLNK